MTPARAQIFRINPDNPQGRLISRVVETLNSGGVIVYPTDTVYGLGCDILNKKAIERIYQIKRKSRRQALSFIVPNLKQISKYAVVSNQNYRILRRFLPGPYTFVLPATRMVPKMISRLNKRTVGIRIPDNRVCLRILAEFPNPIISTSANFSGQDVLADPAEIAEQIGHAVDLVIDSGMLGLESSTVVDLTEEMPVILRQGLGEFETARASLQYTQNRGHNPL